MHAGRCQCWEARTDVETYWLAWMLINSMICEESDELEEHFENMYICGTGSSIRPVQGTLHAKNQNVALGYRRHGRPFPGR